MKKENNYWFLSLSFLLGALFCYSFTQYEYFLINTEINAIETFMSVITALVGFYIAISIQKKITRSQNQYSFIQSKLDTLWSEFNNFSQILNFDNNIELIVLTKFTKDSYQSISFLKNIYAAYDLKDNSLTNLEKNIEEFEKYICALPISDNVYSILENKTEINNQILSISKSFRVILKEINNS